MSRGYSLAEIGKAYSQALDMSQQNIGLDTYRKQFTKDIGSIDLKVIDAELERMYGAGRTVASTFAFPNENILKILIKKITVRNYIDESANIADYAKSLSLKLQPVHRYRMKIVTPKTTGVVPLDARIVIDDLRNAFNHGLVDTYNGNPKRFFLMFSTERVVNPTQRISKN